MKEKTRVFGPTRSSPRYDSPRLEALNIRAGGRRASAAYYSYRWHGEDARSDKRYGWGEMPHDGSMTKDGVREGDDYVWEYTEGPCDKAFMEAQDRKYLTGLARSNPALFLKEMTPRGELSREDQSAELGLDLRSPHHQNLQREFAPEVVRIQNAVGRPAAAAKPTAPTSTPGGGGGGGSGGSEGPARAAASTKPLTAAVAVPAPEKSSAEKEAERLRTAALREAELKKAQEEEEKRAAELKKGAEAARVPTVHPSPIPAAAPVSTAVAALIVPSKPPEITSLVRSLQDRNPSERESAVRELTQLAAVNPENRESIRAAGAMPLLIEGSCDAGALGEASLRAISLLGLMPEDLMTRRDFARYEGKLSESSREDEERAYIKSKKELLDYYSVLQNKLYEVYVAALSIDSGWVQSSDVHVGEEWIGRGVDFAGRFIGALAEGIPIVGSVSKIVTAALGELASIRVKNWMKIFLHYFPPAHQALGKIEEIARQLTFSQEATILAQQPKACNRLWQNLLTLKDKLIVSNIDTPAKALAAKHIQELLLLLVAGSLEKLEMEAICRALGLVTSPCPAPVPTATVIPHLVTPRVFTAAVVPALAPPVASLSGTATRAGTEGAYASGASVEALAKELAGMKAEAASQAKATELEALKIALSEQAAEMASLREAREADAKGLRTAQKQLAAVSKRLPEEDGARGDGSMVLAARTAPEASAAATAMAFAKVTAPIHERLDVVTEELGLLITPEKKFKAEFKEQYFPKAAVSAWFYSQGGEKLVKAFMKIADDRATYKGSQIWSFIKARGMEVNIIHLGKELDPDWAATATAARSAVFARSAEADADANRETLGLAPIG